MNTIELFVFFGVLPLTALLMALIICDPEWVPPEPVDAA